MSDTRVLAVVEQMCIDVVDAGNPNGFPAVHARVEFAKKILETMRTEERKICSQVLVGKPRPCSIHGERCFKEEGKVFRGLVPW